MSRRVIGTLRMPNGDPLPNARLFFTAKRNEAVAIVKEVVSSVVTTGAGAYDVTLEDGYYTVQIECGAVRVTLGSIGVYDGGDTDLNSLLVSGDLPLSPTDQVLEALVAQAEAAAAAAQQVGTSTQLASISFSSSAAITAADSILLAFGKAQAQLNRRAVALAGTVTFPPASSGWGRVDFQSISFSPAFAGADYAIFFDIPDGMPAQLLGQCVAYDKAGNGCKVRATGSGGGTVRWMALRLQ